jgi:hypothetical protein
VTNRAVGAEEHKANRVGMLWWQFQQLGRGLHGLAREIQLRVADGVAWWRREHCARAASAGKARSDPGATHQRRAGSKPMTSRSDLAPAMVLLRDRGSWRVTIVW